MEPTRASTEQYNVGATPPRVIQRSNPFVGLFARTSEAFTAEYVIFLIALGISLSNLASLVYVFFGLIVDTMHGGSASSFFSANMFVLWLAVLSLITIPVASVLWSRIQGELASNNEFKGELPKGAVRGFRSFWITISGLSMLGMLVAAIYAPLVTLVAGTGGVEVLLAVTLPSLINIAILGAGLYITTRRHDQRKRARLLIWVVVGVTAILFTTDFLWAGSVKNTSPTRTTYPSTYDDSYQNLYDDTYYDYTNPSY